MFSVLAVLCLAALTSAQLVDPNAQQGLNVQFTGGQQQQQEGGQAQIQGGQQAGAQSRALYQTANLQPGQAAIVAFGGRPAPPTTYTQTQYVQQGAAQPQQAQVISAVDASRAQIAAAIAQGANPNNFAIQTNAHYTIAQAPNPQNPDVFTALDALRGRNALTIDEILNILSNAVAGRDYPVFNEIPSTRFSCENVKQAGFYADTEAQCQVIRRCDIDGILWSYLCPNMTLFNQITLVCDWFFNVNCNNAVQYYDYSNPRLYTQFALLDTPANVQQLNRPIAPAATQYQVNYAQPQSGFRRL